MGRVQGTTTKRAKRASGLRPVRTPLPIPVPVVTPASPERRWVMPAVLGVSIGAHGAALLLSALLPAPPVAVFEDPSELAIQMLEPEPVVEPEPIPEPELEPETVERPAAIVERPERVRRVDPEPEVEPSEEPPPPAPTLTAGTEGASDWSHPEGEEGGVPGGVPGGEGTGAGEEGPIAVAPPQPRGISRAELRRRLLGYMRGTLWSFVNGRIDYPLAARRDHLEGVVMLRIRLDRDGSLLNVRLSRSSGHRMLDQAALASVQRLSSMPAPPDSIPWDASQELPLPVTYQLLQ